MPEEKYVIDETGCFSYVGAMKHDDAVRYFNDMMKAGIWIDPDCALEKRKEWNFDDKCRMKDKLRKAFETQHEMYGEIAFGIICTDRVTGQMDEDVEFRSS